MHEVSLDARSFDGLRLEVGAEPVDRALAAVGAARGPLRGRVVWHVNSTSKGGGVAELLRPLVGYARGVGMDWRWVTIEANPDFFRITKRIHNLLHGNEGDHGELGDAERAIYDPVLEAEVERLLERAGPDDVVVLHDPQTAGMARTLRGRVAAVVWRCHIGVDEPNAWSERARGFLRPGLDAVDARVFSTSRHVWDGVGSGRLVLIAPSIDPTTSKNHGLSDDTRRAILQATGIRGGGPSVPPVFRSLRGEATVTHPARRIPDGPIPDDVPLVLQVSRWDRLKDPVGVVRGFAEHVAGSGTAHLSLAGPALDGVKDDPEDDESFARVVAARDGVDPAVRDRIHLLQLPMHDLDENGAMVNALQREADVVVQKSLAEGFGLTVAEAMWKSRPVVASDVGGIRDQIEDRRSGLLLRDPADLAEFGSLVRTALDPAALDGLPQRAHERVLDRFLVTREIREHLELLTELVGEGRSTS